MLIAKLGGTHVSDSPFIPYEIAPLFSGIWAHREFSGVPCLYGGRDPSSQGEPLSGNSGFFAAYEDKLTPEGKHLTPLVGGVLVSNMEVSHRRACLHASVFPGKGRHAMRALVVVAAILGDSFGFERFWTYAPEDKKGLSLLAGLKEEGRLVGHALTPEGRKDILIFGGLWADLRKGAADQVSQIEWEVPGGRRN